MDLPSRDDPRRPLALYLERYGEALASPQDPQLAALIQGSYRWVLVVPAFDEAAHCLQTVLQNLSFANQQQALLVICVINAPVDASADARTRTLATLPEKGSNGLIEPMQLQPHRLKGNNANSHTTSHSIDVLTIDAATEPLPADQATGLARKLGNDIACHLMLYGRIKTQLLCNTDADAILPADYFRQLAAAGTTGPDATLRKTTPGAFILSFSHHSDQPDLQAAGQLYELYLRRLYINLAQSGSPYAYPALGSVLAINPMLYAKSRGFPKRRAGEDFYLLNKIAKLAEVVYLAGNPIVLQARASTRVPFGTGPAIERVLQDSQAHFLTYAPASFALLKRFYRGFRELGQPVNARPSVRGPLWPAAWQDPDLLWLLKRLGLPTVLEKLQTNHPNGAAQRRAVHEWFDALKVVRFLNEARHFHPDEPLLPAHSVNPGQVASEINQTLEHNRSTTRHGVSFTT